MVEWIRTSKGRYQGYNKNIFARRRADKMIHVYDAYGFVGMVKTEKELRATYWGSKKGKPYSELSGNAKKYFR